MNRQAERKEETRQRMLEAVSRGFRSHGYAGIGVDGLAKGANVTSGAFYAHFGSKSAAFDAALAAGLDEVIKGVLRFQNEHQADWVTAFVDYYLGKTHRADLACGCAVATLAPEVVRSEHAMHVIFEEKMGVIADLVVQGLAEAPGPSRIDRAWAFLSLLIGGLTIARAVESGVAADGIVRAVRDAAIETAGAACNHVSSQAETT